MTATATRRKPATPTTDAQVREAADRFKIASDPTRLRTILTLADGERNVTELCGMLGINQPALSHHLALLRASRIAAATRRGKSVYYALTETGRTIEKTARGMGA